MTCPELGALRRHLDEPDDVVAGHLAACRTCIAAAGELARNAAAAGTAVRLLAPEQAPDAAADRDDRPAGAPQAAEPAVLDARRGRRRTRLRALGGAAAASLVLLAVVATPAGRDAAADFLAQFRSERLAVVTIHPADDLEGFAGLERLGTVSGDPDEVMLEPVESLAAAAEVAGFPVAEPDPAALPRDVGTEPAILASPSHQLRFTFDDARARAYFDDVGEAGRGLPAGFDGASLVIDVPPLVVLDYPPTEDFGPGLMVGQALAPTADVEGEPDLAEVREFLLDLPGLPPAVVAQLEAIEDWRTTLPLPIPAEHIDWEETTIGGAPGLLFSEPSGLGSAALWQRDGRIYGVGGMVDAEAVRRVADSLG